MFEVSIARHDVEFYPTQLNWGKGGVLCTVMHNFSLPPPALLNSHSWNIQVVESDIIAIVGEGKIVLKNILLTTLASLELKGVGWFYYCGPATASAISRILIPVAADLRLYRTCAAQYSISSRAQIWSDGNLGHERANNVATLLLAPGHRASHCNPAVHIFSCADSYCGRAL